MKSKILFSILTVVVSLGAGASAVAGDATTCKLTGYRNMRFLYVIPYRSKTFSMEYDLNDLKSLGQDREWAHKQCTDAAWNEFNRNRSSVDVVQFEFHDKLTGKRDEGSVQLQDPAEDILYGNRPSVEDGPSPKPVAPPPARNPWGNDDGIPYVEPAA